jgi:hypothetical protein
LAVKFGLVICVGALRAQPTITSITNESGENFLCAGGIAFIKGTGLGPSTSITVAVGGKKAYVIGGGGASLQVELPVDAPQGATTITAGTSSPFNITLGPVLSGDAVQQRQRRGIRNRPPRQFWETRDCRVPGYTE